MSVCACGHSDLGHVDRGLCMAADCTCAVFTTARPTTLERYNEANLDLVHAQAEVIRATARRADSVAGLLDMLTLVVTMGGATAILLAIAWTVRSW